MAAPLNVIEILEPGPFTTVQDAGGRLGYWMVGVPPSGAMDDRSFRLANRAVGNLADAAGLECTAAGATVRVRGPDPVVVCLGGAEMAADVDGYPVPFWQPLTLESGQVLRLGSLTGPGFRAYVAVRGGIEVPVVLGSRATFTLGGFGGHEGRLLRAGDQLAVGTRSGERSPFGVPPDCWPEIDRSWRIGVLEGPHAAPEFFTLDDIDVLYAASWTVQLHCARTGVRLDGPKPSWARHDGGDAGLHPSNIHDTGYAFGALDYTGDTPVVLGPDGPSLGGFTCPATVVRAERWKLGQLAPSDEVRFVPVTAERADDLARHHHRSAATLRRGAATTPLLTPRRDPAGGVLSRTAAVRDRPQLTVLRAGDTFVLAEYGPMTLALALRARGHALVEWMREHAAGVLVDLTAGVRSLLVHLDPDLTTTDEVVELLQKGDEELPATEELEIDARTVHLPLSWEDPATLEAIRRYMDVVRDDAPWCPSNLEFIRRINGVSSVDDVRSIVFDASYLVLGLGDVYLGAPVATPLDPRHRLVTTKYNPARTWTPENAVGIGGAYLCVYGMEGPGGYQLVGRTVPVWYLGVPTPGAEPDVPWLLRPFDQLRFHPVDAAELLDLRGQAKAGELDVQIEPTTFDLAAHRRFLDDEADSIAAFRAEQQAAFAAERDRWRASGEL